MNNVFASCSYKNLTRSTQFQVTKEKAVLYFLF